MIEKKSFEVPSSDGMHTLRGVVFLPDSEAKGVFQVVHGMTEHIGRYERFMKDMAEAGWICFGHDNLGHGYTADNDSELGYIAKDRGWELLAKDVKAFSDAVISEFSQNGKPYCLMGHSMGSFIARIAAERYVKSTKLIVMGTGGSNPAANIALVLISLIKLFKGEKHFSPLLDKLAFGGYNKRFDSSESDPSPWLTTDIEVRERYYADKFCTFKFTISAMGDLIRLVKYSNRSEWHKALSSDVHVLLVSGAEDPVGNYSKGVREVNDKLKRAGKNVDMHIYSGARHEILNDFTYEIVRSDILDFVQR